MRFESVNAFATGSLAEPRWGSSQDLGRKKVGKGGKWLGRGRKGNRNDMKGRKRGRRDLMDRGREWTEEE